MDTKYYHIADCLLQLQGTSFVEVIKTLPGFAVFSVERPLLKDVDFIIQEASMDDIDFAVLYEIEFEHVLFQYGRYEDQYRIRMRDLQTEELFLMSYDSPQSVVYATSTRHSVIFRFAVWMAYNMVMLSKKSLAIHASSVCYSGYAVLFLGESGTGKSTHARLWLEHIQQTGKLNDDSPILRISEQGKVLACGSPWSGKTPYYTRSSYPLKAIIRLYQASENSIKKLSIVESIAALLPSCPPALECDPDQAQAVYAFLSDVLSKVPVYALHCLPDAAAAQLSFSTVFRLTIPNEAFFEQVKTILSQGKRVKIRVKGSSMRPTLRDDRDMVELSPCTSSTIKKGDVVLFRYHGRYYLHRVVGKQWIKNDEKEVGRGKRLWVMEGDGNYKNREYVDDKDIVAVMSLLLRVPTSSAEETLSSKSMVGSDTVAVREISTSSWRYRLYSHVWMALRPLRRPILAFGRKTGWF